jgi:hypothetical protein
MSAFHSIATDPRAFQVGSFVPRATLQGRPELLEAANNGGAKLALAPNVTPRPLAKADRDA